MFLNTRQSDSLAGIVDLAASHTYLISCVSNVFLCVGVCVRVSVYVHVVTALSRGLNIAVGLYRRSCLYVYLLVGCIPLD